MRDLVGAPRGGGARRDVAGARGAERDGVRRLTERAVAQLAVADLAVAQPALADLAGAATLAVA